MVTGDPLDVDVLVVGAGPCGLTLANLLGTYGVTTMIIDREEEPLPFPRAVGMDDETLRTCQAAGLVDEVLADVVTNTAIRYYTSWGRCMAHVKPSARPYGWPRRNLFMQPLFERVLRRGLERFEHVRFATKHELVSFTQEQERVVAQLLSPAGAVAVRSRFLVGADGGRSTVREQLGIELEGETAANRWLVVDVGDDDLDAPYSAVYCHPDSPVLMVPLPYRHRRFEFRLLPNDSEEQVTDPDHVRSLLKPYYEGLSFPRVIRARVYWHHGRVASTFQRGSVFLAGDAAHLQPPFFGQGMNSGIRDAGNLAWKLAMAVGHGGSPRLLATYDRERRPHATTMVDFAVKIGRMYSPRSLATERVRDAVFRAIQIIPGARDYVLQMKYKPMPRYLSPLSFDVDQSDRADPVGRMFPQPEVALPDGTRRLLDDVIGPGFGLLGLDRCPVQELGEDGESWWDDIGAARLHVVAPRSGPPPEAGGRSAPEACPRGCATVEDTDGTFREWRLSRPQDQVVVLRPDRYVMATVTAADLPRVTDTVRQLLRPDAQVRRAG